MRRVLVTGAGGFIGHHLAGDLATRGEWVRGVDLASPAFEATRAHEFQLLDLRRRDACLAATRDIDEMYALAANMGGIGYIVSASAEISRDNVLIDTHLLDAARENGVRRVLYTSSACVYPRYRQGAEDGAPLGEDEAYPADPEDGYGWEKLFAERLCRHYREDFGLETRIARLHNVYGPLGAYAGGREKSPAAICRKVALARDGDAIDVWGDGRQRRSYCYVDDCVEGLRRLMRSDWVEPLNIGQERAVTIDELVDLVAAVAGKRIEKRYDPSRPQGVRARASDNRLARRVLGWEPRVALEDGLARTYAWIAARLADLAAA